MSAITEDMKNLCNNFYSILQEEEIFEPTEEYESGENLSENDTLRSMIGKFFRIVKFVGKLCSKLYETIKEGFSKLNFRNKPNDSKDSRQVKNKTRKEKENFMKTEEDRMFNEMLADFKRQDHSGRSKTESQARKKKVTKLTSGEIFEKPMENMIITYETRTKLQVLLKSDVAVKDPLDAAKLDSSDLIKVFKNTEEEVVSIMCSGKFLGNNLTVVPNLTLEDRQCIESRSEFMQLNNEIIVSPVLKYTAYKAFKPILPQEATLYFYYKDCQNPMVSNITISEGIFVHITVNKRQCLSLEYLIFRTTISDNIFKGAIILLASEPFQVYTMYRNKNHGLMILIASRLNPREHSLQIELYNSNETN
jgi:hypothetical protein